MSHEIERISPIPGECLPCIQVKGGQLPKLVDKAEKALLASEIELYQRAGELVCVAETKSKERDESGVIRDKGALVIVSLRQARLVEIFTRVAVWQRRKDKHYKNQMVSITVDIDCPAKVAATYLARDGQWKVPVLAGIIEAPTLRHDGTLLQEDGYDRATGLMLETDTRFPSVPEEPTKREALRALRTLKGLLRDFPFVDGADCSVALSAILTGLVRRSILSAPMHGFNAPTMGSGKSLLADVVSLMATGRNCATASQARSAEEDQKALLSILLKGDPVVCIDNVEKPIKGDTIATILTQSTFQGRILGHSRMAQVPTNALFLATGNNLTFAGDMMTRAVVSTIDPQRERPEEREFDVDLRKYIIANRPRLVQRSLTILRAYVVAGRPKQPIKPFGRFEEWSDLVRSALVWLGEADPCETRERIETNDPERLGLEQVLNAWWLVFGDRKLTIAGASAEVHEKLEKGDDEVEALDAAWKEAATNDRGKFDSRTFAWWLRRVEGRIINGKKFQKAGDSGHGVKRWQVVEVHPGHPGDLGYHSAAENEKPQRKRSLIDDLPKNNPDDQDKPKRRASNIIEMFDPNTKEGQRYREARRKALLKKINEPKRQRRRIAELRR